MAAFVVGGSYVGGNNLVGGEGVAGLNTDLSLSVRGELFPYVTTVDTTGLDYFNRGEVYPAIYDPPATTSGAADSLTGMNTAISIGIGG